MRSSAPCSRRARTPASETSSIASISTSAAATRTYSPPRAHHEDYVTGETLATSVAYDGSGGEPIEIGGRELSVGVGRTG